MTGFKPLVFEATALATEQQPLPNDNVHRLPNDDEPQPMEVVKLQNHPFWEII